MREPILRARLAAAAPTAVNTRSWDTIIDRFEADLLDAITDHHRAPTARGNPQLNIKQLKSQATSRP